MQVLYIIVPLPLFSSEKIEPELYKYDFHIKIKIYTRGYLERQ